MVKIALDGGHGFYTAGKRSPADEREWTFNSKVLLACSARLNMFKDVQIIRLDDPSGKTDTPLAARTNVANLAKADVLVSIHHNALTGWGTHGGVETFTQPGSSKASVDIARIIQPMIVKAMGLRDRGCKIKDHHITRESRMPAILTEGGFMDSTIDIISMRDESRLRAQGEAIANGLAKYFGLVLKVPTANPTAPKEPVKEVTNVADLFNPKSPAMLDSAKRVLEQLEKSPKADLSTQWRERLNAGKLTNSEALGILFVAIDRGAIVIK